jgi:plastocyanin
MPNTSRLASSKEPPMTPRWILPIVTALMLGASVSAHAATIQITMENLVISPAEASAKVGDTIEWINKDIFAHTATARNGDWDVTMPPKKTVTLVLKKAGMIDYYCRFHPNMKATLAVAP